MIKDDLIVLRDHLKKMMKDVQREINEIELKQKQIKRKLNEQMAESGSGSDKGRPDRGDIR